MKTCCCSAIGTAVFDEPLVVHGNGGVVLVRNIEFASTCCETLMPFHGDCHIAYVPSQPRVLGLSKLARLVSIHSKRICSQRCMTDALRSAIDTHMPCAGVFVCTRARHLAQAISAEQSVLGSMSGCFSDPGSSQAQVRTPTSAMTVLISMLSSRVYLEHSKQQAEPVRP